MSLILKWIKVSYVSQKESINTSAYSYDEITFETKDLKKRSFKILKLGL